MTHTHSCEKLKSLTSLRFFAALLILFQHTTELLQLDRGWTGRIVTNQGVAFFFVLSGFILSHSYPTFSGFSDIRRFWISRWARIWPLHFFTLVLLWIFLPLSAIAAPGESLWGSLLANLTLLHAWFPWKSLHFSWNRPSWSLSAEMFFYLAFPFLIWKWRTNGLWKILCTFGAVAGIITWVNWAQLPDFSPTYDGATTSALIYINPLSRVFEFTLGIAIYSVWTRLRPHSNAWPFWKNTLAEVAVVLLVVCWLFWTYPLAAWLGPAIGKGGIEWILRNGGCLPFAVLILVMALERGPISRFLRFGVWVLLGEISYSIYLLHHVEMRILKYHFGSHLLEAAQNSGVVAAIWALIFLTSYWAWRGIELPARRFLLTLWDSKFFEPRQRPS